MKSLKTSAIVLSMLLIASSLIAAASTVSLQSSDDISATGEGNQNPNPLTSYAEISCYLYEGDGCQCIPVRFVEIYTYGLDTDHNDSNITDENGFCILRLEYDQTYRVIIEVEEFEKIIMDFIVIDDQTFAFHLQEKEDSSTQPFSFARNLIEHLRIIRTR
jgi:hypothetical protein